MPALKGFCQYSKILFSAGNAKDDTTKVIKHAQIQ